MAKLDMEVELFASVNSEGITSSLYIANIDEPLTESLMSWEEVIEREMEYVALLGEDKALAVDLINDIDSVKDVMSMVETFRDVADRLEQRVKSSPIFLRHLWLNNGSKPGTINQYYITFDEYTRMVK